MVKTGWIWLDRNTIRIGLDLEYRRVASFASFTNISVPFYEMGHFGRNLNALLF